MFSLLPSYQPSASRPVPCELELIVCPMPFGMSRSGEKALHRQLFTRFEFLSRDLCQRPQMVLAPLWGRGHDILDIAEVLSREGYAGRLCAIGPQLPNKEMICREVRAVWSLGQFDILEAPVRNGKTGPRIPD